MKDTHKYSNNFKEKEYQKAIQFLEKGCECGCSATLPKERFAILRNSFQKLTFLEKDAFVMGQLTNTRGGDMTTSSRFPKHERTNRRNFYIFEHNKPICQETFLNMLGISQKYLKNMKKHLVNKGIYTRIHGNTGKTPFRKTKILVDLNVREEVRDFVLNYARTHGLPNPGRVKRANNITIYLPTEMTYKSVHEDFLNSLEADSALRELRYRVFVKI